MYDIASGKVERSFAPEDGGPPVTQVLQWSERGIFFTRGQITGGRPTPNEDPNRIVFGQVWFANPDGSGAREVEVALPQGTEVVEYGVPRISPDGNRVGYTFLADVVNQAGQPINGWRVAVADVVYEPDGAIRLDTPRFLTNDSYYNETKDWSGDSNQFIFASTRGEGEDRRALNADAFVIDAAGAIRRITHAPSWEEAHDVLRGDFGPGDADVFISDRDTPNLTSSPYYSTPDLIRSDADSVLVATAVLSLAVWTSHELFVSGPRGDLGPIRRLTHDYRAGDGWVARLPLWSPDGRHIRFDQWRAHAATAAGTRSRLLTFDCAEPVQLPRGCLSAPRRADRKRLGVARLGRPRNAQRLALGVRLLGRRGGIDRWCLAGGGALRIGYPTSRLRSSHPGRGLVERSLGRALIALSTSRSTSIRGVSPGDSADGLRGMRRYRIGRNVWFVAPGKRSRLVFKTRGGRVLELGIADLRLTRSRLALRSLLHAWHL